MRRALGIAVFSGMLGVTLFGIFLTPVFYYALEKLAGESHPPAQSNEKSDLPGSPIHANGHTNGDAASAHGGQPHVQTTSKESEAGTKL
jgi:multidrug efflux pump